MGFVPMPDILNIGLIEHECEMLSMCCGAPPNEYVDWFCNGCNESAAFECNECEDNNAT